MTSIKEMRKIAQPRKKFNISWFSRVFSRKISIYITWTCIKMGISANGVSYSKIVIGLLGPIFIAVLNFKLNAIGALFLVFWYILDDVDGEVARVTNVASLRGKFLDNVGHYLIDNAPFLGAGMHAFWLTESEVPLIMSMIAYVFKYGHFGVHKTSKLIIGESFKQANLNIMEERFNMNEKTKSFLKTAIHAIFSNQFIVIMFGMTILLSHPYGPLMLVAVLFFYGIGLPIYFILFFLARYRSPQLNNPDIEDYH